MSQRLNEEQLLQYIGLLEALVRGIYAMSCCDEVDQELAAIEDFHDEHGFEELVPR